MNFFLHRFMYIDCIVFFNNNLYIVQTVLYKKDKGYTYIYV